MEINLAARGGVGSFRLSIAINISLHVCRTGEGYLLMCTKNAS